MKPPRWRRGGWVNDKWRHRAAQVTRAAEFDTAIHDDEQPDPAPAVSPVLVVPGTTSNEEER